LTPALDLAVAFHARFLVMLESYSDDSLSGPIAEQPNRICVVAGWFGDGAAWRDLERNWQGTTRREGLHEFKASDCHGGYGEFKNWGEDRCLAFRRVLVGLLVSSSRIVGAATIMTFDPDPPH